MYNTDYFGVLVFCFNVFFCFSEILVDANITVLFFVFFCVCFFLHCIDAEAVCIFQQTILLCTT